MAYIIASRLSARGLLGCWKVLYMYCLIRVRAKLILRQRFIFLLKAEIKSDLIRVCYA